MKNLRAYIRKSIVDGETASPARQRAAIERWTAGRYDLIFYEDLDISGRHEANRPGWLSLLADLDPATDAGVIVESIDRSHRNVKEFLTFYDDLLEPRGLTLISATQNIDLASADGRYMATILMGYGEMESRKAAERMANAISDKQAREGRHWGRTPFGADRDPETCHLIPSVTLYQYQPATGQAGPAQSDSLPSPGWELRRYYHALQNLYQLYASQEMSYTDVADLANRAGWQAWLPDRLTPIPFTARSARRILQQAHLYQGGPQPDGWTAQHEPLLSPDLCQAVQAQTRSRSFIRDPRHNPERIYLLTGLIYCGQCGQRLSGQNSNSRYRGQDRIYSYYRHSYPTRSCHQPGIPAEKLEAQVIDCLIELTQQPPLARLLDTDLADLLAQPLDGPVSNRLAEAHSELERLIDLHISGLITKEQFIRRQDPLQIEIEQLQKKARPLPEQALILGRELAGLNYNLHQAPPRSLRELLRECIQRLEIIDRQINRLVWSPWLTILLDSR